MQINRLLFKHSQAEYKLCERIELNSGIIVKLRYLICISPCMSRYRVGIVWNTIWSDACFSEISSISLSHLYLVLELRTNNMIHFSAGTGGAGDSKFSDRCSGKLRSFLKICWNIGPKSNFSGFWGIFE